MAYLCSFDGEINSMPCPTVLLIVLRRFADVRSKWRKCGRVGGRWRKGVDGFSGSPIPGDPSSP